MVMVMQDGDDGAGNVDDGEGRRSKERKDGETEGTGEKMESAKKMRKEGPKIVLFNLTIIILKCQVFLLHKKK